MAGAPAVLAEFADRWKRDPHSFRTGAFRGEVIGYIVTQVAIIIATAGEAAVVGPYAEILAALNWVNDPRADELAAESRGLSHAERGDLGDAAHGAESVGSSRTGDVTGKFTVTERAVIDEAETVLTADSFDKIRAAHVDAKSVTVEINGVTIQYEPGLPASGMTMFGEKGFLVGPDAFSSPLELKKTILHELHRLRTSGSAAGVSAEMASEETKAAFDFAERASKVIQ